MQLLHHILVSQIVLNKLGEKECVTGCNSRQHTPCKFYAYYQPHIVTSGQNPLMPIIFSMPNVVACGPVTIVAC